jgi:hypothetical protein
MTLQRREFIWTTGMDLAEFTRNIAQSGWEISQHETVLSAPDELTYIAYKEL